MALLTPAPDQFRRYNTRLRVLTPALVLHGGLWLCAELPAVDAGNSGVQVPLKR